MANDKKGSGGGMRIPRNLKPDLESVNSLLSDMVTKLGSVEALFEKDWGLNITVKGIGEVDSMERKLEKLSQTEAGASKINKKLAESLGQLAKTRLVMAKAQDDQGKKILKGNKELVDQEQKIKKILDEKLEIVEKIKKAQGKKIDQDKVIKKLEAGGAPSGKVAVANLKTQKEKLDNLGEAVNDLKKKKTGLIESEMEARKASNMIEAENGKNVESLKMMEKQVQGLDSAFSVMAKVGMGQALIALDKLGTALITLAIDSVFFSLNLLKQGFMKVYDLMERTTAATGAFNLSLGGTTAGLDSTRKAAWGVEGQMRSLTGGELGVGLKMWEETAHAVGFLGGDFDEMTTKATLAGRALGIGGAAAGELTHMAIQLGDTSKDVNHNMVAISDSANLAGVSVADFGKEITQSKGFMVSFGKVGQAMFLKSAAYAKKLGVSLQSLAKFTEMTDTFESTATAAAKLNTVFGTNISSIDLMMEQDPSKRLETVRQALKAQGKTWEGMNRQERKYMADTMGLSEEEMAGVLNNEMTLEQFEKKKAKADKKKISDEDTIRDGLAQTAQTLHNFGASWDHVTAAVGRLIKPILKVFGLATDVEDKMSFGVKMTMMFDKLIRFIDKIGKNKKVIDFIEAIAKDLGSIFDILTGDGPESKKMIDDIVESVGSFADGVKELYTAGKEVVKTIFTKENLGYAMSFFRFVADNIGAIIAGFVGLKVVLGGMSVISGIVSVVEAIGAAGGLSSVLATMGTVVTSVLAPLALLAAAAALGALIGTAIQSAAENITIGGKSVQDIFLDTALAWKDNMSLFFTDSWELIKTLIRSQIPGFMEDLIPDFLKDKGSKDLAKEHSMSLTGEGGLEGVMAKLKDSKGGEGLSEKQLSSLGTRFADWRDSDIKKVLEEGGIKDISGTLEKMRAKAGAKYDTGYQDPAMAGWKGVDLNKGEHVLSLKGNANEKMKPLQIPGQVPATSQPAGVTPSSGPVNLAQVAKSQSSTANGQQITVVAGDVYLDGNAVGRVLPKYSNG